MSLHHVKKAEMFVKKKRFSIGNDCSKAAHSMRAAAGTSLWVRTEQQSQRITRICHGCRSLEADRAACVRGRGARRICAIGTAPTPRHGCLLPARCSPPLQTLHQQAHLVVAERARARLRGRAGTGMGASAPEPPSPPNAALETVLGELGFAVPGACPPGKGPCNGGAVVATGPPGHRATDGGDLVPHPAPVRWVGGGLQPSLVLPWGPVPTPPDSVEMLHAHAWTLLRPLRGDAPAPADPRQSHRRQRPGSAHAEETLAPGICGFAGTDASPPLLGPNLARRCPAPGAYLCKGLGTLVGKTQTLPVAGGAAGYLGQLHAPLNPVRGEIGSEKPPDSSAWLRRSRDRAHGQLCCHSTGTLLGSAWGQLPVLGAGTIPGRGSARPWPPPGTWHLPSAAEGLARALPALSGSAPHPASPGQVCAQGGSSGCCIPRPNQ